jgi:hypothetical protein
VLKTNTIFREIKRPEQLSLHEICRQEKNVIFDKIYLQSKYFVMSGPTFVAVNN